MIEQWYLMCNELNTLELAIGLEQLSEEQPSVFL